MVDVASPSASSDAPGGPRSRAEEKRPLWLLAIYLLFLLVCLNAARTYRDQKRLVRLQIEERTRSDGEELHYSAGAEEHVVSSNYGSSMYGGSIHAAASPGVKKRKPVRPVNFDNVRPKPSDGTKDYNTELQREDGKHPPSDFGGFSFYAMADTPVRNKKRAEISRCAFCAFSSFGRAAVHSIPGAHSYFVAVV